MAKKPLPTSTETENKIMTETPVNKEVPEASELTREMPKDYNPANSICLGDEWREIKSTKIKYQRNGATLASRILERFALPDVLSVGAGTFDPERDGDQIVFDFLVAVFDDVEFVKKHYDDMTAADIDKILEIFCRLNGITEREEKNRVAKETKT